MKKLFLIILLFASIEHAATAQILNSDFENWTADSSGIYKPDNWSLLGIGNRSTVSYSGSYSLLIHTFYNNIPGWVISGKFDHNTNNPEDIPNVSGTPITYIPGRLSGFYKYTNVPPGDSAHASVILKKYNSVSNKIDTIAAGDIKLGPANAYTPFSIDIEKIIAGIFPDTMIIQFISGDIICPGSTDCAFLYIDSLTLSQLTSVNHIEQVPTSVTISPNPFSENASIELRTDESSIAGEFRLLDYRGQEVNRQHFRGKNITVERNNLSPGVYIYSIITSEQFITGKIVIQ